MGQALLLLVFVGPAHAERATTRDALERLEEVLEMRQEDGVLQAERVLPAVLVSAKPLYEASQGRFGVQALGTLTRVFGGKGIRACEACMQPRTEVEQGRMVHTTGPIALDEIVRLDDRFRGDAARARTAIWLDETPDGVALRITDLRTSGVVFAQNVDPDLIEFQRSENSFKLSAELERRTRGESLTHAIVDIGLFPGQHVSLEWDDQWGDTNANLSGLVISLFDPVLGIGVSYARIIDFWSISFGAQAILSIPTLVAESLADEDVDLIDPTLTAAAIMRIPLGGSNYAGMIFVSTNGQVGIGLSLLNTSLIPVLP